jgi:hypothetical protein
MRRVLALTMVAAGSVATACGGGGGSKALPLGTEATVGYQQSRGARTTLGVTVLAVRQGTQEQLKQGGYEVDPENRSTTPYYVDVRYKNQGDQTVKRDVSVGLEDSDGNLIGSTLIFDFGGKPFGRCRNVSGGTLAPSESFEDCTLFLVPEGVDVGKVDFLSDEGPGKEPRFVYWDAA